MHLRRHTITASNKAQRIFRACMKEITKSGVENPEHEFFGIPYIHSHYHRFDCEIKHMSLCVSDGFRWVFFQENPNWNGITITVFSPYWLAFGHLSRINSDRIWLDDGCFFVHPHCVKKQINPSICRKLISNKKNHHRSQKRMRMRIRTSTIADWSNKWGYKNA